jgi:L-alanine-DL-glutamate epimerase-like enolase superfamily enzyme
MHPTRRPPVRAQHPDLFQPFGGFADGVEVVDGHVTLPELPGIGFEGKADLYREIRSLAE